jgi:hypothetical protein
MGGFIAVVSIFVVLGIVFGIGILQGQQRKQEQQDVKRQGVRLVGWIVQANNALFQPGLNDLPAQVIITFDDVPNVTEYLEKIGKKLYSLKSGYGIDPVERQVAKLVKDETFVYGSRVKLPTEFTGGPTVYSCHVIIERQCLLHGCLKLPFVECKAMPGDKGIVCMVPYEMYPEMGLSN